MLIPFFWKVFLSSNLGLSKRYKIPRYKIQDIERLLPQGYFISCIFVSCIFVSYRKTAIYRFTAIMTIFSHSSSYPIPMAAAAWGRRLVGVMPGRVLASRHQGVPLSSRMKSKRA